MSRLEAAQKELVQLRMRQVKATVIPAICIEMPFVLASGAAYPAALTAAAGVVWLLILAFLLHLIWKRTFPAYRAWSEQAAAIASEVSKLRRRVTAVFAKYRKRRKGERFKTVYRLVGRTVPELEEALAVGMFHERREVFVTAFMRAGVAVRVTASIGSPFSCRASDDPRRWAGHYVRLGCDEVRQYHNHPDHHGKTRPSAKDFRATQSLRKTLVPHGEKLRTFIICWNGSREWRVFEYDDDEHWLCYEFDAAV